MTYPQHKQPVIQSTKPAKNPAMAKITHTKVQTNITSANNTDKIPDIIHSRHPAMQSTMPRMRSPMAAKMPAIHDMMILNGGRRL